MSVIVGALNQLAIEFEDLGGLGGLPMPVIGAGCALTDLVRFRSCEGTVVELVFLRRARFKGRSTALLLGAGGSGGAAQAGDAPGGS